MVDITPLEEAVLNAQEIAAGFAAMQLIKELLEKGEAAKNICKDRTQTREARAQGLRDSRHVNNVLNLIATQRAMIGIDA